MNDAPRNATAPETDGDDETAHSGEKTEVRRNTRISIYSRFLHVQLFCSAFQMYRQRICQLCDAPNLRAPVHAHSHHKMRPCTRSPNTTICQYTALTHCFHCTYHCTLWLCTPLATCDIRHGSRNNIIDALLVRFIRH